MRIVALRDPKIVEVNGRRGRAWTGKNEDGNITVVTLYETGDDKIEIDVETLELPTEKGKT